VVSEGGIDVFYKLLISLVSIVATMLLTNCAATPETHFYAISSGLTDQRAQTPATDEIALRIGPFEFPTYLQRPNIVTRHAGNRIDVAEFHRWAGSLEDDFHHALGSNLGVLLHSSRISVFPAEMRFEPDYYLTGEVVRFDGDLGGTLTLEVRWMINRSSTRDALVVEHSVLSEPIQGSEYTDLVVAYTRVLVSLGKAVQSALLGLDRNRS
jgi:hypothetical protein